MVTKEVRSSSTVVDRSVRPLLERGAYAEILLTRSVELMQAVLLTRVRRGVPSEGLRERIAEIQAHLDSKVVAQ